GKSKSWLQSKLKKLRWPGRRAYPQLASFIWDVRKGDKVIASTSGRGIYALGTVIGDYEFNNELEYSHSRKMRWETTFWHPVDIDSLKLRRNLNNKFKGRSSSTIRELEEKDWDCLCKKLNGVNTPFRNLEMWGGLIQSPEYEN